MFLNGTSAHISPLYSFALGIKYMLISTLTKFPVIQSPSSSSCISSWPPDPLLCFLHTCIPNFHPHHPWTSVTTGPLYKLFFQPVTLFSTFRISSDVILYEETCLCPRPCNKCTQVGPPILSILWLLLHFSEICLIFVHLPLYCKLPTHYFIYARLNVLHIVDTQ